MKRIFLVLSLLFTSLAYSAETIRIQTPYTASHSGTPAMLRIIDVANQIQKNYTFVLEFKPGGNQVIAVKQMDQDPQRNLAIVAASFVENAELGQIKAEDYVPVWSLGDACWTVMSTVSNGVAEIRGLQNAQEIVVGTVGFGNATHLTALQIGKKYNIPVRLVPFKSNFDAVVNMAGNNGVTLGIDTPEAFANFQPKNSKLHMLAVSCNQRLPEYPRIKTLREQGIVAPAVMNIIVANVAMPADKRKQLGRILEQAADQIGENEIRKSSGFIPPQFEKMSAQEHFTKSTELIGRLRNQFEKEIKQSQ
jgi:tripartite-type tricarboxylate transporter receptor subunit TctC